jgi:hypothetical protein
VCWTLQNLKDSENKQKALHYTSIFTPLPHSQTQRAPKIDDDADGQVSESLATTIGSQLAANKLAILSITNGRAGVVATAVRPLVLRAQLWLQVVSLQWSVHIRTWSTRAYA